MDTAKESQLGQEYTRFIRACRQIQLLDQQLDSLQIRYKRVHVGNNKTFRYHLRIKLATIEGVRRYYYIYCWRKAHVIARLEKELYEAGVAVSDLVEDPPSEEDDL